MMQLFVPVEAQRCRLSIVMICCSFFSLQAAVHSEEADTVRRGVALRAVEVRAHQATQRTGNVSQQSLTIQDIQQRGILDIADALKRMAGTQVRDYGGAGGMITLSVRSLGATHTGVVYDGVNVTDCESGQIDLSRFDLTQLKSLDLISGDRDQIFVPARVLASAATLFLHTGKPSFTDVQPHLDTQVSTGSFGYLAPYVAWQQRFNRQWALRLRGDYLRADNQYPFTLVNHTLVTQERRHHNKVSNGRIEADVFYDSPDAGTSLATKVYFYDSFKQLPGQVVYYNSDSRQSVHFTNAFVQSALNHRLGVHWWMNAHVKAGWSRSRYHDEPFAGQFTRNHYRQQEYYGSLSWLYAPWENMQFTAASDYAYSLLSGNAIDSRRPHRHAFYQSVAAKYTQEHFTATATLLMSLYRHGALEGVAARNAQRLSPSLTLAWHPCDEHLTLRLSYKDIFRMPTFSDNYFTRMGNRNLLPEKAQQLGAGVAWIDSRSERFNYSVEVDAYCNKVKNKIVAMPMNMFFWNIVNLGKVDILGTDVKALTHIKMCRWLSAEMMANYTYQYAINKTDATSKYYKDQIAYTPRHSVSGSVSLLMPWVNVSVHTNAVSRRYAANQSIDYLRLDPYQEWGASIYREWTLPKFKLLLRADAINFTDEQYEVVRLYPMPGRSWRFTLKLTI